MYTLKCRYTPYIEANADGSYKDDPWLVIEDRTDAGGWSGHWSFATFDYLVREQFMNGTLSEKANAPGLFKFKLYYDSFMNYDGDIFGTFDESKLVESCEKTPINPNYSPQTPINIDRGFTWRNIDAFRTCCSLYEDENLIFEGRFCSVEEYMESDGRIYKLVTCESQLAYLCDVVADGNEIRERLGSSSPTLQNIAKAVVQCYNDIAGGYAGWIVHDMALKFTSFGTGSTDYSYLLDSSSPDNFFNWIKKIFVEELGGCVWITYNTKYAKNEDGYLVLNIAPNRSVSQTKKQTIELGKNMKSLTIRNAYNESGNITQYVPYGGVGADGTRLMLDHVTQKVYGGTGEITRREVENGALFNSYGPIQEPLMCDDLVDDGQKTYDEIVAMEKIMLARAQEQARQLNSRITSIEVSALDLSYAGLNVSTFVVGAVYSVKNPLLDFEGDFQLLEREIDLASPWDGRLTFGSGLRKMSGQTANRFSNIDKRIHNVERTISTRLDGASVKLNGKSGALTQSEFDALLTQHAADPDKMLIRDDVLYFPEQSDGTTVHAYKGTKRLVISEGGGGGTIEYAAVIAEGQQSQWIPEHELIPVFYNAGCAAYYGGAPARMIVQGNRVLFNVPYDEITIDDISSDVYWTDTNGAVHHLQSSISSQTAERIVIHVALYIDGVLNSRYGDFTFNATPDRLNNFCFGVVLDYTTLTKNTSRDSSVFSKSHWGTVSTPRTEANMGSGSTSTKREICAAAFLDGSPIRPVSWYCTTQILYPAIPIFSESEWHFDNGCAKRYEAEV